MKRADIRERIICGLGWMEERTFERVWWLAARLLAPIIGMCLLVILSLEIYCYAINSERSLRLEYVIQHTDPLGVQSIVNSEVMGGEALKSEREDTRQEPPRYTLETITEAALALGIHVDKAESGSGCTSLGTLPDQQIQISFSSSFSQMRKLYSHLYSVKSDIILDPVILERLNQRDTGHTVNAKFCISVVPKTSSYPEKLATKAGNDKHML